MRRKRTYFKEEKKTYEMLERFTLKELASLSLEDLYTRFPASAYLYFLTEADRKCGHPYDGCTCYTDHTTGFYVPDWDVEVRIKISESES